MKSLKVLNVLQASMVESCVVHLHPKEPSESIRQDELQSHVAPSNATSSMVVVVCFFESVTISELNACKSDVERKTDMTVIRTEVWDFQETYNCNISQCRGRDK